MLEGKINRKDWGLAWSKNVEGTGAVVATVFCDSNKKYLSTDLCQHEPMQDHYLSRDLDLLGCRVLPPR